MSSSIFFKFKSQKEPSPITFDGTSLSVFEVKREIIAYNKLGDGTDFDLEIYSVDTNEVYNDDTVQIPRSTTVIARRLPAAKPGAGRAARYVSGKMPVMAKNQHRIENMHSTNGITPLSQASTASNKAMSEEEKLQAMFSENKASWQEAQAEIAAKGVNNRPFFAKSTAAPDKPVPDGYICHRCGQKGHWIQACPTNTDPTFDGRPKFRRTTGIPRSFLQKIDKANVVDEDGKVDVSKLPSGVMFTPEGEFVVSRPDEASWQKFQDQNKVNAEQKKQADEELEEVRERGLECTLSHVLVDDPVKTPCCGTTYSRAAIENELIEKDFVCPSCGNQVLLDDLTTDEETAVKVKEYKEEKATQKATKQESTEEYASQKQATTSVTSEAVNVKSPAPEDNKSPSPTPSKKRAAEEELEKEVEGAKMQKRLSQDDTSTKPVQPIMQVPKNTADFVAQMNQMFGTMPAMQNGMPAYSNPMMVNPMMMGLGMPMIPPNMMPVMPMGYINSQGAFNSNGQGTFNSNGQGMFNGNGTPTGPRGWQSNGGNQQNGDGAYFRQPVNPNRHRGRQNRPRSMDYKQL